MTATATGQLGSRKPEQEPPAKADPAPAQDPGPAPNLGSSRSDRRAPARADAVRHDADPTTDSTDLPIEIIPERLDLGLIPVGDAGIGSVTLRNTGDHPITLKKCKASCGCTTVDCPTRKALAPGEEVEVKVKMQAGFVNQGMTSTMVKTVNFFFDDSDRLTVVVSGEASAYVVAEPLYIDPTVIEDGRLIIKARDGQPFKIKRMTPQNITSEALPVDSLPQHVLHIDWEKWKTQGSDKQLNFFLDHPNAPRVLAVVRPSIHGAKEEAAKLAQARRGALASERGSAPPAQRERLGTVVGASETREPPRRRSLPIEAVMRAVNSGRVQPIIDRVAAGGVDANLTDESGTSLLALVAKEGEPALVKALIEQGADVNAADKLGRTPLIMAAQSKNPEVVEVLLASEARVTDRDLVGSALSWAAGFGDARSVELLIEAGSTLEVRGSATGFTPLMWAAGFGEAASVSALIEAGAEADATDLTHHATPLMHAARTGSPDKIKLLVAAGVPLEAKEVTGKTALLVAAEAGGADAAMLQTLIDAGADLKATDARGRNALDLAMRRTDPKAREVVVLLEKHMQRTASRD